VISDATLYAAGAKRVERIGGALLVLGDCREIAPKLPRPAALISDPPYGMKWDTNAKRFSRGGNDWGASIVGDAEPFDPAPWLALGVPAVLWGMNHFSDRLPAGRTLIWLKQHPDAFGAFLSDGEVAWANGGTGVFVFYKHRAANPGAGEGVNERQHPTQKPSTLMRWSIERAKVPPGGTILDPYMGSGTTLVAAVQMGHPCIGIEIEPRYFDTACRRVAEAARQPSLFVPAAPAPVQHSLSYPTTAMGDA
jgi:DNA modification methylase